MHRFEAGYPLQFLACSNLGDRAPLLTETETGSNPVAPAILKRSLTIIVLCVLMFMKSKYMESDMSKYEIIYEWVVEQVDEHGDIQDTYAVDSYKEAVDEESTYSTKDIALVRDKGNDEETVVERGYAYVQDGILEERFCSGQKVPANYLKEVRNAHVQ